MTKKFIRERRSLVETMLMIFFGSIIILMGFMVTLISVPLMVIIIGFFTLIGGIAMIGFGVAMMLNSRYKLVNCPKCSRGVNPRKDKVICVSCKNILEFKNGK